MNLKRGTTLLLAACWVFGVEPSSAFSLVPNGSFEKGSPTPVEWQVDATPRPGGRASFAIDPESVAAGARSLRLSATGPASIEVTSMPFDVPLEVQGPRYLLSLRYRAVGLSSGRRFEGVNVVFAVAWQDATGRVIERVDIAAPYSAQPWSPVVAFADAPSKTVRASVVISLYARENTLPTTVWLDDVRLRPWRTESMPEPAVSTWSVGDDRIQSSRARVVADDDTPSGYSALANPRFMKEEFYLVDHLEVSDIPPGAYHADFRIRTAPSPSPDVVLQIDCGNTSVLNRVISSRNLHGTDLPKSSAYRNIALPFLASSGGRDSFRVRWLGGVSTWVDSITLTEERLLDAAEFDDLLAP